MERYRNYDFGGVIANVLGVVHAFGELRFARRLSVHS
jgi:hypothetical protein